MWRPNVCVTLALLSSTLGLSVVGFVAPSTKLNIAANPHTTMFLPPGAATPLSSTSLSSSSGALHAAEIVGSNIAAGAVETAEAALATAAATPTTGHIPPWAVILGGGLGGGMLEEHMDPTKLGLFAFAGLGVAAAGFSTAVYWRMQYVVSGMALYRKCVVASCVLLLLRSSLNTLLI